MSYFKNSEFRCKCCGTLPANGMDSTLVTALNILRGEVGVPIYVTSGYRCPKHNKDVGGVSHSFHTLGLAVDVLIPCGYTVDSFALLASDLGIDGIGCYYSDGFVHLDVRDGCNYGNYRWSKK